MKHRIITYGLIGIFLFGSVSGLFTVVCQGFDGHVKLEPALHNHCRCAPVTSLPTDNLQQTPLHTHCMDTAPPCSTLIPDSQKPAPEKLIATVTPELKVLLPSPFLCRSNLLNGTHPFHMPLRTIVLLA